MAGRDPSAPAEVDLDRVPSVVASHVDITYRVFSGHRPEHELGDEGRFRQAWGRATEGVGMREVHAIKDVSFVTYPGESIGVIGRNGSGKSTLLRSIAGLVAPTGGRLWINGKASLLGVNAVLIPKLTGRRNVWIGCLALGMTPDQVASRYDEIVEFAGIGDFVDLPMSTYSSGMTARLRFAISTAVVPEILVVDEALATGDAAFRERATERIADIRRQAGTVFIVSHNDATITRMCSRAMWIDEGRLLADGDPGPVAGLYRRKYGKHRHVWRERYEEVQQVIEQHGFDAARDLLRRWEPEAGW